MAADARWETLCRVRRRRQLANAHDASSDGACPARGGRHRKVSLEAHAARARAWHRARPGWGELRWSRPRARARGEAGTGERRGGGEGVCRSPLVVSLGPSFGAERSTRSPPLISAPSPALRRASWSGVLATKAKNETAKGQSKEEKGEKKGEREGRRAVTQEGRRGKRRKEGRDGKQAKEDEREREREEGRERETRLRHR